MSALTWGYRYCDLILLKYTQLLVVLQHQRTNPMFVFWTSYTQSCRFLSCAADMTHLGITETSKWGNGAEGTTGEGEMPQSLGSFVIQASAQLLDNKLKTLRRRVKLATVVFHGTLNIRNQLSTFFYSLPQKRGYEV